MSFDWGRLEQWMRDSQPPEEEPRSAARRRLMARLLLAAAGVVVLIVFVSVAKGQYTEWLWFDNLGFSSVFKTVLITKMGLFFASAFLFFAVFGGNLYLATRLAPRTEVSFWPWAHLPGLRHLVRAGAILGAVVLSLIFGLVALGKWEVVLRYLNGQPFGLTDPVFQKEVGFYVFSMPFYYALRGWLLGAFIVTFLFTVGLYALSHVVQGLRLDFERRVKGHLAALLVAVVGLFAWSYWLGIWELVLSRRGVVFGAGYADINAKFPVQWLLFSVVLIVIVLIVVTVFRRNYRLLGYGFAGWIVLAIIAGGIYPWAIERFQVQPNELNLETPYIEYNIQFTRDAFALNRIEEQAYPAEATLDLAAVNRNQATIDNIRLWDHRPLKDTYNQNQSLRLYYDFNDVDVDRYTIGGQYRQVMLSARELSVDKLEAQAQTWVNRRLLFTHGYGVVMSPVNEISAQGLPILLVRDIPPTGVLDIERPEIYYGEKTADYVIVGAGTDEFDFPKGEENMLGRYQGQGGVPIGSFLRRVIYAWQFGDFNILISGELTPQSRILYSRNISERVSHLAPFLQLDGDPYLVVADGRLFWIQDAYTTTERYPYSEPLSTGVNYIRNSVKAVIDAYHGSVTFYVTDPSDPLVRTYQAIFPNLFTAWEEMPASLGAHVRYPEDLFRAQALVYQTYHMRDVRTFYNKEDVWAFPREIYAGTEQLMDPYYVIMRMPGEESEEFLLILPFTPVNKNNTIGWLAARSDGDQYGNLLAFVFPKEKLVFGPSQIESRISQDTQITEQLALWSRGGANVIRGNMLLIPIEDSYLYVEPIFLQAQAGALPELKQVIVAIGERIAMRDTLQQGLAAVFGQAPPTTRPPVTPPGGEPLPVEVASLIQQAQEHYTQAQEFLRQGDWAGYGQELEELKAVLERLAELAPQ